MHQEDFDDDGSASRDLQFFSAYADLSVHAVMLGDAPRMDYYRGALRRLADIRLDDGQLVVLDVGAGTGVLSVWASREARAAHVFAVEASELATALLPAMLRANGVDVPARATVVPHRFEELAERDGGPEGFAQEYLRPRSLRGVDVVVSEFMGFYLLHEGMLPSVLLARDFLARVNALEGRPPPRMLPSAATLWAAPVTLRPLRDATRAEWAARVGSAAQLDVTPVADAAFEARIAGANPLIAVLPANALLAEPVAFKTFDLQTVAVEDTLNVSGRAAFALSAAAADGVDGIALWFDVGDGGEDRLSTGPRDAPTHWQQSTVLLPDELRGTITAAELAGEPLVVRLTLTCSDVKRRTYELGIEFE